MKLTKKIATKVHSRLPSLLVIVAILTLNTVSAFAQGTGFNSTDLKTGISNSLAVIMMFGFVLGISCVIYGGFAIRRGDVDQGKMSIIGGAIMAAVLSTLSTAGGHGSAGAIIIAGSGLPPRSARGRPGDDITGDKSVRELISKGKGNYY